MARTRLFFLRPLIIGGSLYAYSVATTLYLNAAFLETLISRTLVGVLFAAAAIVALVGLTYAPRILHRISVRNFALITTFLSLLSLIGMVTHPVLWVPLASFVVYFASNTMTMYAIDVLIETVADPKHMGRIRGVYLALSSAGFMLAPAIAGFLVDRLGFGALYTWAAVVVVIVFTLLFARAPAFKHAADAHSPHMTTQNTWRSFFRIGYLRHVYMANFLLQFFYAWMVVYTPLLLHDTLGVPWNDIGLIFTIMLSAFVLLQAPAGWLIDKVCGERKLMIVGFLILGIATVLFAYVAVPGTPLWVVALVLFATRIGASLIEVTTESAFFKSVTPDDTARIGIFRNTYPLAYLIGPALASGLLLFIPTKALFGILGLICFIGVWHAIKLQKGTGRPLNQA